tara:strand:- start:1672 stop:2043 length:372 start_codon:yes stop_codon:yes gene_type:complete
MEIVGKIKVINETQTFDSGFQKREIVVTTEETYPQDIKLEFTKDKCSILDQYKVGQSVTVAFNLRGNEYNGKYYVNLQGWKIGHNDGTEVILEEVREQNVPALNGDMANQFNEQQEGADDLPF